MAILRFQQGGAAPAPEEQESAAPEQGGTPEQGGGDPVAQLAQIAQEALQSQNCEAAMAVCEGFLQLLSGGAGGQEPAPEQGQPVYRKGGKLAYRVHR